MANLWVKVHIFRSQLARFHNDGISCYQSWSSLTGNQEERKVPWEYSCSYAYRFLKQEDILIRTVTLDNFALITACPPCHVIKIFGCYTYFDICQSLRFTAFTNNNIGKFGSMLTDAICKFIEIMATLNGSYFFPFNLCFLCSIYCGSGICLRTFRLTTDYLFC